MSSPDPFGLVGQVLDGQFRVDRFIGEGGFSVVYAGHHLGLSEPIALKCMKLPAQLSSALVETFVQRFRDESRLHYKLSQGNLHIARTMAAGTTVSPVTRALVPYMVLEWLDGHSMAAELERSHERRTLAQVLELFETAVDALVFAQAQGVVHRDLNPGNFFLTKTVAGVRLKVLDFGVAKVLDESRLAIGPRVQTMGQIRIFAPAYGAPEQFDDKLGPIGPYTDVYALALVLLETMAGRTVMSGEHLGDFAMAALDPANRPSPKSVGVSLSAEVEAVFARAFALRPQDRWPTVKDFWVALRMASRLPGHSSEEGGNATMLLATMPLDNTRGSSSKEAVATLVDEGPTDVAILPVEPSPATARLGASLFGPASLPQTPALVATAPISPAASPLPPEKVDDKDSLASTIALSEPPVVKKGDRSQLVTLAMATRPSLPGDPGVAPSAAPPAPRPAAGLASTMVMPEAPRLSNPSVGERPPIDPERVSYVPPQARTVALAAHAPVVAPPPPAGFRAPNAEPSSPGDGRISELPGLPSNLADRISPVPAPIPNVPPGAPVFAKDDSPIEPPTTKTGPIGLAIGIAGVVLAVLLLGGGGLWLWRGRHAGDAPKPAPSVAPSSTYAIVVPSEAPTTSATASETPSAPPPDLPAPDAPAPSVPPAVASVVPPPASAIPGPKKPGEPPRPAVPVAPVVPVDPNAFDAALARTKLDHANGVLVVCKSPDGPSGKGSASVVFAPSGQVTSVGLTVPFEGTKAGTCVRGQLMRVKTAPFVGSPQSLAYVFTVPK